MQLENSFTVPVPIDEAWRVLLDIERIAPCMPGAVLDSVDGDDFTGRVKVKLGPINLTYQGKASFIEKDEAAHKAVIDARGKDQRGNGTAAAVVTARLTDAGAETRVDVVTDLNITGRPAQFGRGVMTDVGNKLLGQFATKLAAQLGEGDEQGDAARAGAAVTAKAASAAAAVSGAVEEVAASAEQAAGAGAPAKKAATATKKTAAAASDKAAEKAADKAPAKAAPAAAPAKAAAAKAAPAKAAPAKAAPEKAASEKAAPVKESPAAKVTAAKVTAAKAEATVPVQKAVPAEKAGRAEEVPAKDMLDEVAPLKVVADTAPADSVPSAVSSTLPPLRSVATPPGGRARVEPEPIDLLEVAGGAAMARYAAPAAGIAAVVVLVVLVVKRRRG